MATYVDRVETSVVRYEPGPLPETVEDPFLVTFGDTNVALASVKQKTLPNLPVWAFWSVMMIAAG